MYAMSLYLLGDLAVLVKGVDIPLRISILLHIGLYAFYTIKPSILSRLTFLIPDDSQLQSTSTYTAVPIFNEK